MPQDVPAEASELLVFTPASLEALSPLPKFMLRACTSREKRFRLRMQREEGIFTHSTAAFRLAMLEGLKAQWTEDQFDQFSGWVTDYWDAQDSFDKLLEEEPDAVWAYDAATEQAVLDLQEKLEKSWRPLARMVADAAEFRQTQPLFYVAVTVSGWTGVDLTLELDRNYLTLDCADALQKAMSKLDIKAKVEPGTSFAELFIECVRRNHLDEDEGKNSESPSPSKTTQPASTATSTTEKDGSSPASKTPSSKIPAGA